MKYFLLLVLERKVKIPAPVWEMVAHAAAAPFLPPCMFMVLHRKFVVNQDALPQKCCLIRVTLLLALIYFDIGCHKFQQHFWFQLIRSRMSLAPRQIQGLLCTEL